MVRNLVLLVHKEHKVHKGLRERLEHRVVKVQILEHKVQQVLKEDRVPKVQ